MGSQVTLDWSGCVSYDKIAVYHAARGIYERLNSGRNGESVPFPPFSKIWERARGTAGLFLRDQGFDINDEEASDLMRQYYDKNYKERNIRPTLIPGARPFLEELYHLRIPVTIVSSHPQHCIEREADFYGVLSYLDRIYGGTLRKEDAILENLKHIGGSRIQDSPHIGDMDFDVYAALAAGVPAFVVSHPPYGYQNRAYLEKEFKGKLGVHFFGNLAEILDSDIL